ncbi:hypothetical protein MRX96_010358 [Rhipicephalus microplus]
MKTALLLCLLTAVDQRQSTAHHHSAPQPRTDCHHQYWLYQPASTVGGFQYPYSGHHGYQPPHGYFYAPGYQQPGYQPPGYQQPGYLDGRHIIPLPPLPPPPPPSSLPYPGPWVPSYPRQPKPKNLDPFPGKFLGMGTVRYLNGGRDVELVCDLHGNQLVSNVVWVKATHPRGQPPVTWRPPPPSCGPCFCPVQYGCVYQHLDLADRRFFADTKGHHASLTIYGVSPADFGVYRCSATSSPTGSAAAHTETVYQIVHFTG